MFVIPVDAFSKWLEVKHITAATYEITIEHISGIFTSHCLLELLITYNRTPFTSSEFEIFMVKNGIRHVMLLPFI